jgi:hypothetical protein
MTRFLCFALLLAIAASLCAQEEPMAGLSPPRDPAPLLRREQITRELQQIQRMRSIVNPNDKELIESLDAQQVNLIKQLREIPQQMQPGPLPLLNENGIPQGPMMPPTGRMGMPAMPGITDLLPGRETGLETDLALPQTPRGNNVPPGFPMPQMPDALSNPQQMPAYQATPPQIPPYGGGQNWYDQEREMTYWGPKLPKELTEVKQSVESLKREIAELKDTIKVLETQIQLLNRNIVLSERVKENGN